MKKKIVGRPLKFKDKLSHSINLKLSEVDFKRLQDKARKIRLTPTVYARQMVLKGCVKAPFSVEELGLIRKIAGEANNLNQIAKHLNSGFESHKIYACAVIKRLKELVDGSKEY